MYLNVSELVSYFVVVEFDIHCLQCIYIEMDMQLNTGTIKLNTGITF